MGTRRNRVHAGNGYLVVAVLSLAVGIVLMLACGVLFAGCAGPAEAQAGCDRHGCGRLDCATPARPAPSNLWQGLEAMGPDPYPQDMTVGRDTTRFNEFSGPSFSSWSWWESLDIENGFLFGGIAHGIQVWDLRTNPANPPLIGVTKFAAWPVWINDPHNYWPLHDVDAPAGDDSVVATVGQAGIGLAIFNTTNKAAPVFRYQAHHLDATQVYAARLNGRRYAFVASYASPGGGWGGGGLHVFDMDAAIALPVNCNEGRPAVCPGVYVGRIGTRTDVHYIDGIDDLIIFSAGALKGVEVWRVADPANPQRLISALPTANVYGVAIWKQGATYYAGLITDHYVNGVGSVFELELYDSTCGATTCAPLSVTTVSGGSSEQLLMFSRAGDGRPFLYATKNDACNDGTPQREFLFDVSDPRHPVEVGGVAYWDWYYRGSATGFNRVAPLGGKMWGDYFYRAGHSIFDVHKLRMIGPPPPEIHADGYESGSLARWSAVRSPAVPPGPEPTPTPAPTPQPTPQPTPPPPSCQSPTRPPPCLPGWQKYGGCCYPPGS